MGTPRLFPITRAQRVALFKVFQRDFPSWTSPGKRLAARQPHDWDDRFERVPTIQWRNFRRKVQPYFDKSGCVMIPWKGMWLGIEKDGYTHS